MFFSSNDWQSITFRLAVALLVGGVIGINRQSNGRPASLRTFIVVSLSAALFAMIPLQIGGDDSFVDSAIARSTALNAIARIVQGVATGVGFLGTGIILREQKSEFSRQEVKGVTTAATIWLVGGLGAAAGCGLWQMSLVACSLALLVLTKFKKLKKSNLIFFNNKSKEIENAQAQK
ncbi:MgtC/SapB family protein [Nostoc sp. FACHB-888]|uniref:MgtC/SapB family protein n=1 Tax=Nostoc sp. FACHB-888 TaxID=2692842 RepID=UPI0016889D08|nr:MgtC/SapB family protein [Nostoc sp. FACHB-888]MBD2247964.1 MgtC/SapB family protein [Nostoc sp. FACHB-888]